MGIDLTEASLFRWKFQGGITECTVEEQEPKISFQVLFVSYRVNYFTTLFALQLETKIRFISSQCHIYVSRACYLHKI